MSDVFVPESRTFDIANGKRHYEHPIYDYPFIPFAEASFSAVNIGICRHFFEEAETVLKQYQSAGNEQRYNFVSGLILMQQSVLNEATEAFYLALGRSWEALIHDKKIEERILNEVSHTAKKVVSIALCAAQSVYPYLGLSVTMERTTLNRCWRDLHTASQHILLKSFE